MPKYVIERNLPGAGQLSPPELRQISQKSCGVLRGLGPDIQWLHSYVTAGSAEIVREHARQGGFPADRISEVRAEIDPTSAEAPAS
jgi:hypothetical protein